MSAGKGTRLARKRKFDADLQSTSGSSVHDITDDFEDSATVFRLPFKPLKKLETEQVSVPPRSRGRPKKIGTRPAAHSDVSCKETEIPKLLNEDNNAFLEQLLSQRLDYQEEVIEDNFLLELEKSICSESEKFCPCCKHIVSCAVFSDHYKECLQKFKLNKGESERKFTTIAGEETQDKIEGESASEDNPQLLPCPVCLKSQKSKIQRQSHIKICAKSHGLTLEQLLLASKLTEKQVEERSQLRLPVLVQQTNSDSDRCTEKKSKAKRNNKESVKINNKDHDLAMALALSRSVAEEEAESRSSRDEKLLALGLDQIVDEDRQAQPLIFPFSETGNQRATTSQTRNRGRKRQGNFSKTPLATRSVEERERLISEKVASILTSEDTPRVSWQNKGNSRAKGRLSKFKNEACKLWETAYRCTDQPLEEFYVPELEPYIKPQSIAVGGLLRRLSQIPGRLNLTSIQSMSDENSDSGSDCGETSVVDGYCTQLALAELLGSQDSLNITRDSISLKEDAVTPLTRDSLPNPNVTLEPASGFWVVHTTESVGSGQISQKSDEDTGQNYSETHKDNHYCDSALGSSTNGNGGRTTERIVLDQKNGNVSEMYDKRSIVSNDKSSAIKAAQQQCIVTEKDTSVGNKKESKLRNSSKRTMVYKDDTKCDELNKLSTVSINDEGFVDNASVDNECQKDNFESDIGHHEKFLHFKNNQHISNCNSDCEVIAVLNNSLEHTKITQLESLPTTGLELPSSCIRIEGQRSSSLQQAVANSQESLVLSTLDENSKSSECSDGSDATHIFMEEDYEDSCSNNSKKLHNVESLPFTDDIEGRDTNKCYATERINSDSVMDVRSPQETPNECEKSRCLQEKFIYDWSNFLSNEKKTDVIVTISDGSVILAHSLIFFVRCSLLYKEVIDAEMNINWDAVSYESATNFLVYLYTGTCNIKTKSDPMWMDVYELALKYKCEELVSYLESLYISCNTSANTKSPIKTPRICEMVSSASNSDSHILKTPKRSSLQETNEESGRKVRRILKLSSVGKDSFLPKSPENRILQADSDKLEQSPENSNFLSEGVQIMESRSPDLFDESIPGKDVSFISTPSNSPPALVNLNKSAWSEGTHSIHSEPVLISKKTCKNSNSSSQNFISSLHVTESNMTSLLGDQSLIYKKVKATEKANTTEQEQNSSVCGQTNGQSSRKNILDCEEGSSKLLKASDQSKFSDCPEARDNMIDLTLSSCDNSPASCTNNDALSLPGDQKNILDFDPLEEMEPLKLWADSNSPKTDESKCQEELVMAFNRDDSRAENVRLEQEQEDINETCISNVWEDFDDVDNAMSVPINVCQTPVKRTLRSDTNADTIDDILPSLMPSPSKKKNTSLFIGTESNIRVKPVSQCEPMASALYMTPGKEASARKCLGQAYSVTAKSKEANAIEFNSSLSDETMVKITEDIDCNKACEEFEQVEGCKQICEKRNESEVFHVPLTNIMTPQPKKTSKKQIVTPLPDYKNMSSPALKKELTKYGVRPLARRKAVVLLQHVYEQTHPLVTDSEAESSFCETPKEKSHSSNIKTTTTQHENVKGKNKQSTKTAKGKELCKKFPAKRKNNKVVSASDGGESDEAEEESSRYNSSQMSGTSCSTDDSKYDCLEESELFGIGDDDIISPSQQADIGSQVVQFISSDSKLHRKVLMYEPIFVEELQASLKANGIKCSVKNLLEVLDDQCITFRTQNNRRHGPRRPRQRRSFKRKKRHSSTSH